MYNDDWNTDHRRGLKKKSTDNKKKIKLLEKALQQAHINSEMWKGVWKAINWCQNPIKLDRCTFCESDYSSNWTNSVFPNIFTLRLKNHLKLKSALDHICCSVNFWVSCRHINYLSRDYLLLWHNHQYGLPLVHHPQLESKNNFYWDIIYDPFPGSYM